MSDPYRKGRSGGRAVMAAELQNRLVEMAQDFVSERGFSQQEMSIGDTELRIYNTSALYLNRFAVVGLGPPLVDPSQDISSWKQAMTFQSVAPDIGLYFAILQEECPAGIIVDALVSGETHCYIQMTDLSHKFAGPIAGDYTQLGSSSAHAGAEILWVGLPEEPVELAGNINPTDLLLTVTDVGEFDDKLKLPFVATIDSEDILVTDLNPPDNQTWGVERGYNGTTAASHSAGAAITFKTGTVWATVRLGPSGKGTTVRYFQADSQTPIGGFYPATEFDYDRATETWVAAGKGWLVQPNSLPPVPGFLYAAVQMDDAVQLGTIQADVYTETLPTHTWTNPGLHMSANGALVIDGVTLEVGDTLAYNPGLDWATGVYKVEVAGDPSTKAQLFRVEALDESDEIVADRLVLITDGDTYAGTLWNLEVAHTPVTVDSTNLKLLNTGLGANFAEARYWSAIDSKTGDVPFVVDLYVTNLGFAYTWNGSDTITANVNGAMPMQDTHVFGPPIGTLGVVPFVGMTLFYSKATFQSDNGIWEVIQVGDSSSPAILKRHTDWNTTAKCKPGSLMYIKLGGPQSQYLGRLFTLHFFPFFNLNDLDWIIGSWYPTRVTHYHTQDSGILYTAFSDHLVRFSSETRDLINAAATQTHDGAFTVNGPLLAYGVTYLGQTGGVFFRYQNAPPYAFAPVLAAMGVVDPSGNGDVHPPSGGSFYPGFALWASENISIGVAMSGAYAGQVYRFGLSAFTSFPLGSTTPPGTRLFMPYGGGIAADNGSYFEDGFTGDLHPGARSIGGVVVGGGTPIPPSLTPAQILAVLAFNGF